MSSLLVFQWFIFCFHVLSTCSTSEPFDIPRLSPIDRGVVKDLEGKFTIPKDLDEYSYNQTLDHFNYAPESYKTFQQKYILHSKCWGIANSGLPIFAYLGAESPLDDQFYGSGFLLDTAPKFNACLLYMEHRFYGNSSPLGSQQLAMQNKNIRGYFNSAQALADYAKIITHVKKILSAETSPVIVFGGSYGGMLASWFRLKYPHVVLGALASSAPVRYFHDLVSDDAYYYIVSKDFNDSSPSCFNTIKNSWAEIGNTGLQDLSKKFNTCGPLTNPKRLKNKLRRMYSDAAMYDIPPLYPVSKVICNAIDGAISNGSSIVDSIAKGALAYWAIYEPQRSCYINRPRDNSYDETISQQQPSYNEMTEGWTWQCCSEIETPLASGNNSMFEPKPYNFNGTMQSCKNKYHVDPRPHWIIEYYGGRNLTATLKRFGSNIIYSNGLRDPWVLGGVLEDISDTIVTVKTKKGCHCLDLLLPNNQTDPDWLVKQRETEIKIIQEWIDQYYDDNGIIKPTISTFSKKIEK